MILAIEAASTDPSVAVAAPDGTLLGLDGWSSTPRRAHELLPRLLALLAGSGGDVTNVSAVAVGTGPGSFTGLRVAMSVGKGLAFALGVPIVGVPSLEAWLASEPTAAGAASRAGAREAYLLERDGAEPRLVDRDALPREQTLVAPVELATAFGLNGWIGPGRAAAAVADAAARRLQAEPGGDDLEHLEPRYLRLPRGVPATVVEGP